MSNFSNDPTLAPAPRPVASDDVTVTGVRTTVEVPALPAVPTAPPGYCIERELGRGGMGVVYLAHQIGLNRPVALKMVLTGLQASPSELVRFLAEAEAIAQLHHPNVVQIYEVGSHAGVPYFTLEFCAGGCLDTKLAGNALSSDESARLMEAIARGVHAAHARGIVHRDLKPQNVLLSADGSPKVTDFGVAKRLGGGSDLTQTGAVMGTPSYMAPEQAAGKGKEVSPAADVYSLGAILYEMLTGRPPFKAGTPLDTLMLVVSDDPIRPRQLNPRAPLDLETIALKCLNKDPRKRYPTAEAMADDLARFRTRQPITARPVTAVERGWRWVRRNPLLAGVAVGGPLLLAVTTVVVLVALLMTATANVRLAAERQNAENQRVEAEGQKELAHARLGKAIEAVDKMLTRVGSERWATNPALQEERRQVLEEAVAFYTGFGAEDSSDPDVRREAAKAHTRLAGVYLMLGEMEKSAAAAGEATRLYDGLMTEFPNDADYSAAAAEVRSLAGNAAALQARYDDALREYTRAVELADAARERVPGSVLYKLRAVEARSALGYFYLMDDRSKGERLVKVMLELAHDIGTPADALYEHRVALAFALTVGAAYDLSRSDPRAAVAKYDEAAKVLDTLTGKPASYARARDQYAHTRAVVSVQRGFVTGMMASSADGKREGAKLVRAGVDQLDELLGVNPKAFPFRLQKFQALRILTDLYTSLREPAEAAVMAAAADRLMDDMLRENPSLLWLRGLDAYRQSIKLVERVRADPSQEFESDAEKMLGYGRQRRQWDVLYNVACAYAVATGKRSAADPNATKAVAILNELARTNYFRVRQRMDHLSEDADLKPLHGRDDFNAFLDAVKSAPADPPKPK